MRSVLAALPLLALLFWTGCAQDQSEPGLASAPSVVVPSGMAMTTAAFVSEVVARATLIPDSRTAKAVDGGVDERGHPRYWPILEFRFTVAEYLKGTGGGELTVLIGDERAAQSTYEDALEVARGWSDAHNSIWDDREAIIFADQAIIFADGTTAIPGTGGAYFLRRVPKYYRFLEYTIQDPEYTIDTPFKVWLPSSALGDSRFMLDHPSMGIASEAQPRTTSVAQVKSLIVETSKWEARFDNDPEYRECIISRFYADADAEYFRIETDGAFRFDPYVYDEFTSGMPAETVVYGEEGSIHIVGDTWFEGEHKELFSDFDDGVLKAKRPLPAGEYIIYFNIYYNDYEPCGYQYPDELKYTNPWSITAVAPAGVVHEAFFDPAESGGKVGFSNTFGRLSPADFTIGQTETTIRSLYWESGKAKLTLEPSASLAGHSLDFIALDGTVSTTLRAADATSSGGTLTWNVASQPWSDGDLLMLRARDVGVAPDPTPTATPTPTPTPTPAPPEAPTITSVVPGSSSNQLVVTWEWNGDSCFVTGRSSGYEVIYKKATVASWRDPSEITAQEPNDSDSGAYEIFVDFGRKAISQTFTIGASASGSKSHGQIGAALDAVAYDLRVAVYSDVCNELSPDSEVRRGTPTR